MKKLLTLALAVLSFTAAQAATISWTGVTEGATTTAGTIKNENLGVWAGNSATIIASITYTGNIGTGTVLSYADPAHGNKYLNVGIDTNGNYTLTAATAGNDGTITTGATVAAGGEQKIAISVKRDGSNVFEAQVSVNGVVIATYNDANCGGGPINQIAWGRNALNTDANYSGSATYEVWGTGVNNGEGAYMSAADAYKEAQALPEPTALALLALGVAGLALKRKHA